MSFIWPQALALLVLLPLGILPTSSSAAGGGERPPPWRDSSGVRPDARAGAVLGGVPAVLILAGISVMVIALARPQGTIDVPRQEGTVILAFDVSGSMAATDLTPTRIDAARAAATDFVKRQPASVVIGVVAFSDAGLLGPAADQRPGDGDRGTRPPDAPEAGRRWGRASSRRWTPSPPEAAGPTINYYSNASPAPTPSPTPVPAGAHAPAGDRPAH